MRRTRVLRSLPSGATPVGIFAGALELTLGRYLDIIEALQPDIFASLGDELPHGADSKRVRISVDRTLRWLDACLREHEARGLACPLPMAAIQGAGQEAERRRSAVESAKRSVSGERSDAQPALLSINVQGWLLLQYRVRLRLDAGHA